MSNDRAVYAYPPEIEELAFVCYIDADRNVSRAHRMLAELCTMQRGLDDAEVPIPDRSTISRWARQKSWDAKADEAVADTFPNLRRRQLARLAKLNDLAIANKAMILNHEFVNMNTGRELKTHELQAISAMIAQSFLVNGMGPNMAGKEVPQPTPSVQVEAEGTLTVQERMRRQRERLEADRG